MANIFQASSLQIVLDMVHLSQVNTHTFLFYLSKCNGPWNKKKRPFKSYNSMQRLKWKGPLVSHHTHTVVSELIKQEASSYDHLLCILVPKCQLQGHPLVCRLATRRISRSLKDYRKGQPVCVMLARQEHVLASTCSWAARLSSIKLIACCRD